MGTRRQAKWSDVPNIDQIREMSNQSDFAKGEKLYQEGSVVKVQMGKNNAQATVYDNGQYSVSLKAQRKYDLYINCTCQRYMFENMCPHAIATFLYLNENTEDIDVYGKVTEDTVDYMISSIPSDKLSAFLTKMMAEDGQVFHRFIKECNLRSEYQMSKHASELVGMYKHAAGSNGKIKTSPDLGDYFDDALKARIDGKTQAAAKMYRVMVDTMSEWTDKVTDDTGYHNDCFIEAVEGMVECILRQQTSHEQKREYISYLFEKAAATKGTGLARYYRTALETICSTDKDLEFWKQLVSIPKDADGNQLGEMLRMKSHILENTNKHTEIVALLDQHYSLDSDICIRYLNALRTIDNAGSDAQKAITAFPEETKVLEAAYDLLPENGQDRINTLEKLYCITGDWSHIVRLKQILQDWNESKYAVIKRVTEKTPKMGVELCLKEDLYDLAMEILETADMELLTNYKSKLLRKHPQRYLSCFANLLTEFVGAKSGKDHYKRVIEYLAALKDMPDSNEQYESALKQIKKRYSNRHTLIKALADV